MTFQYIQCYGSSVAVYPIPLGVEGFQYIQCYGSSSTPIRRFIPNQHFNTSNVMVLLCMIVRLNAFPQKFQYIQCYGSSAGL